MNPLHSGPVRFLAQKARAGFGLALDIEAACVEKQVLCPAETSEVEPASFLPGHLERIIATPSEYGLDEEIAKVTRRTSSHAETAAYRFTGGRLYRGSALAGGYRHFLQPADRAPTQPFLEVGNAALVSTLVGLKYFGHWLADDLAIHDLVEPHQTRISLPLADWPDVKLYCELLDRSFETADNAFFRELTIYKDFSQNSLKAGRYRTMRSRLRSRIEQGGKGRIVYLSRGTTGALRPIEEEDRFVDTLQRYGVTVLSVEHDSTKSILQALHGAEIFITVEGSQQKHCLFALPDTAAVLLIQPPRRFNLLLKGPTDCLGWPLGFVVGDDRGDDFFAVNADEVLAMIDELQKRL